MIWLTVAVVIVLYLLKKMVEAHPLDKVPGPKKLPIIGNTWEVARMPPVEYFKLLQVYARQFGNRFVLKYFNKRILNVYSLRDVEVVLSHSRNIQKSSHYGILSPWLGTGLLTSSGNKWRMRRKLLTPTFHFEILRNFLMTFEELSRGFVERLAATREPRDLVPLVKHYVLLSLCETAMGIRLDADTSQATVEYVKAVNNMGPLLFDRVFSIWLEFDFIYRRLPSGKHFFKSLNAIHSYADKVINERRQMRQTIEANGAKSQEDGSKRRSVFLDMLLDAESRGEIDQDGIRDEVNTFLLAGHETTANALSFCLMHIADCPDVQDKIRAEFLRVTGGCDDPEMSCYSQLKYLEAVIKETLRLYPITATFGRTLIEDINLDGLRVAAGTDVMVRIHELHRLEELYPEPNEFKPERFLGEEPPAFAYVPFSAGPRNCIGQRYAMLSMKCVLSKICARFVVTPAKPRHRPPLALHTVLHPTEPILIKFLPR